MSTQQDIYAAGSENRPPMLNKDNYVPWSSRIIRYARSRPNGKMIVDSIENGPYVRRMIATPGEPDLPVPVPETFHEQTDEELTENDIKRMDADDQAIQTILLGLPEDVYAAVDSCETAKEIWERVRQMMKGSDIGEQEKKAKLFNEWEKFTSTDGESIESYYHRFMQLMNDLKRNKHFPENIAANLKFLNNLQPEWKRHVTIVRQTKNLHEADFTQIYDFLKMNQDEVNELRAERLAKTHDPLALMAHSQNPYNFPATHNDQSSSSTHSQQSFPINNKYNPQPSFNQNFMQPPMTSLEDINDPTEAMNAALILFAKAFQLTTPTNNNQRTSSNPRNRQIAQPGMNMGQDRQIQNIGGNGGNQFGQYAGQVAQNQQGYNAWQNVGNQVAQNTVQNPGVQNGGNQNGLVVVPGIANQNGTGNIIAVRAEGTRNGNQVMCYNCRGLGHIARNCTAKPRRIDAAYLQTHLLIAQKEEAGIQLQVEEFDFMAATADLDEIEEVNANCILMANLQQASTSEQYTDLLEPIPEPQLVPQNDNNVTSVAPSMVQSGGTIETSSAPNEETRAHQETIYRNLIDQVAHVNKCLTRKINDLHLSSAKQITTLNDEISNLNKQLSKEKSTISSLMEEKKRLKHDFKTREDKYLDKEVDLEAKIKELENILLKRDQTVQTMHMLNPKPDSFYHQDQKMALGYPNPLYLKQAQLKQQSLYDGNLLLEKHDPPAVYDSEETLELAQESREKMRFLKKEIKPVNYAKINHLSGVFVPQTTKSKEELFLSNVSNMVTVSKTISIPIEDLSDDTTPSVARKFLNEVKNSLVTLQRVVKQKMTLEVHNWSSSAHKEVHKIISHEIAPIINQVDARVQNFEIQFLKEAAKFVRDFKSLAKEADESLDKQKSLELEIERLLKASVSHDIMSIVQNSFVDVLSNLQTELDPQLGDLKGKRSITPSASNTLDPLNQKLETKIVELEFQVVNYEREIRHLKTTYKNLFDSITSNRANAKLHNLIYENAKLRAQVFEKTSESMNNTSGTSVTPQVDKPKLSAVTPFPKKLHASIPSHSVPQPKEFNVVKHSNVIAPGMFKIDPSQTSRVDLVPNNQSSASIRTNPITNTQHHVTFKEHVSSDTVNSSSTGLVHTARTRRPQPKGNTRNDRVPSASKSSKAKKNVTVEDHRRNLSLSKTQKTMSSECNNIKLAIRNDNSEIVYGTCKQCFVTANHDACLPSFVNALNSRANNLCAKVPLVQIKRDIGHSSFDLKGKLVASNETNCPNDDNACPSNPQEPIRKRFPNSTVFLGRRNTCFIRDLDGVDLLKGNRTTNLYTINLYDMASASPICLMTRATPTKSWLWHQRVSHLNFDTINDLAKNDHVSGLPKFKYAKEHLCPSCEQEKSKRASHPPKPVLNSKQRLHMLHIDLCGPMRVASINGKRYILVIVDDYSRYTWVHFLRTKDETPEVIKNFLKNIYVRLQALVIIVRTDNGTEFALKEYFNTVGITHETSAAKTPQQNRVVERRNHTLVKAARTMLIFSHAPLFLWAEAIATACYTQNHSIIHRRFNKTPYELIQGRKPDISYLHVFGALCYPKNDREDIGKLGAKGDIGFFIGYSANSVAYKVYNRRTKKIIETMNVTFDELSAMTFEQNSSKPGLQSLTSGQISSGLELTYAPSTITPQKPSERDLDIIFEPLHNEYLGGQPSEAPRTVPAAPIIQNLQAPTTSMTIQDSAPTPTNSSNTPNSSHNVDEQSQHHAQQQGNHTPLPTASAADNVQNAVFEGDLFINPFAIPSTESAESSTQNVDPLNMHTFYQPYLHNY
ncbi:retrovirus-related pol polyprotein from transposon TNT 1-94 [Tanacetum coccineum]